jgi:hypothetical protein
MIESLFYTTRTCEGLFFEELGKIGLDRPRVVHRRAINTAAEVIDRSYSEKRINGHNDYLIWGCYVRKISKGCSLPGQKEPRADAIEIRAETRDAAIQVSRLLGLG